MLFNSLTFLLFFIIVLTIYNAKLSWKLKKYFLLIGSYFFYAAWHPPLIVLLWISTASDWFIASKLSTTKSSTLKKWLLFLSVLINLGLLIYFKYSAFLLSNLQSILDSTNVQIKLPSDSIILPLGISFYTFQSMSYTIDIYKGRLKPSKNLSDFALYVSFFPQLVAGPIVKARKFLPQLIHPKFTKLHNLYWGLLLSTFGLFQKVIVADTLLAPIANTTFEMPSTLSLVDSWVGVLAFSVQILSDFSGYSLMAIGIAYCFGFKLPKNFNAPYSSIGFSDFWKRWHISLSSWLKEYLYISIGGNRKSLNRTYFNLMVTMLLGGIWHGASWSFIMWGALHGFFLVLEHMFKNRFNPKLLNHYVFRTLAGIFTFLLVNIAWVFFRSPEISSSFLYLEAMLGMNEFASETLNSFQINVTIAVVAATLLAQRLFRYRNLRSEIMRLPSWAISAIWVLMIVTILGSDNNANEFVYFQF